MRLATCIPSFGVYLSPFYYYFFSMLTREYVCFTRTEIECVCRREIKREMQALNYDRRVCSRAEREK